MFVATLVAMVARRVHVPYTVGLVLAGMALYFLPLGLTLHLSKELIFSVFLPPLVFEAALSIRWSDMRRDLAVVGLLASAGVVVAAVLTAAGMHEFAAWDWPAAVLFGVLIAATDPVSVIATFREARVHGRLSLLVEAESLLNDGTAAVLFTVALAVAQGGTATPWHVAQSLLIAVGGGVLCGAVTGWAAMLLAGKSEDGLIEITLTTLAAYGSFHLAEHLHCSGVLAALAAGLAVGNSDNARVLSRSARQSVMSFWEYAAFAANSLIFLLIGRSISQQDFVSLWWPALVAIVLVTAGRAVAIYPLCALFQRSNLKVELRHQHILFWGGLRGALALALALGLPEELPWRNEVVTVCFAVVAFSIFAQGLTMTPLLRRLGQIPARGQSASEHP
jgi:CPA1 family monovalent cation:H+ antiporter